MTTARDVIEGALRLIRVHDPGESVPAADATTGLDALNALLDSWNTEPLMLFVEKDDNIALNGSRTYTIGPGGDIDTRRPLRITDAYARENQIDYPVQIVGDSWYARIADKFTTGRPEYLQYDASYPLGTVKLWPVGTASYTLFLTSHKLLPTFDNLSDNLNLPPGYERAVRYNLAIELAPEYGAEVSRAVAQRADEAKTGIKRINSRPPSTQADYATLQRAGTDYSIYSDQ